MDSVSLPAPQRALKQRTSREGNTGQVGVMGEEEGALPHINEMMV